MRVSGCAANGRGAGTTGGGAVATGTCTTGAGIGLGAGTGLRAGAGLGEGIGLSKESRPGIVGAVRFDVAIAGRLGAAIVAEFGEPVGHLGPAVFLVHASVVLPVLDFHVEPPVATR